MTGLTLLDYHRLRSEEERSWDRARLRREAWGRIHRSRYPDVQQIGSMGWKAVDSEHGIGFQV